MGMDLECGRYSRAYGGSDCGWVDYVQWSGSYPAGIWDTISYTYDAAGRRVTKAVDGQTTTKYVYDGDHCIAEYSGSNQLLRKYIYGPRVDEPVCMIEAAGDATYYYHLDGLGSIIALSDEDGNAPVLYEYSVYGQVAASDPNHPNRFLFTGREFDKETGLYYYRARYYNPEIGRFLQTDPVGYTAGVNLYTYCGNNPVNHLDPSGEFWGSVIGGAIGGAVGGISGAWRGGWTGFVSGAVGGAVTGAMIGAGVPAPTEGAAGGAVGAGLNAAINELVYGDVTPFEAVVEIGLGAGGGAVWANWFPGGDWATSIGVGFFTGASSIMTESALKVVEVIPSKFDDFIRQLRVDEFNWSAK
jgi:RHS repeat-associated protein